MGDVPEPQNLYIYEQNLLDTADTRIKVYVYQEREVTEEILSSFVDALSIPRGIGLGWSNTAKGALTVLVLSSKDKAILIQFASKSSREERVLQARRRLQSLILCNPQVTLYAFDMGRLALSLYRDRELRIANAVHIQGACKATASHSVIGAVDFAVSGTDIRHWSVNTAAAFSNTVWESQPVSMASVVFRAWLSAYISLIGDMEERLGCVKRVNTEKMADAVSAFSLVAFRWLIVSSIHSNCVRSLTSIGAITDWMGKDRVLPTTNSRSCATPSTRIRLVSGPTAFRLVCEQRYVQYSPLQFFLFALWY